jgi:hypothetical protein
MFNKLASETQVFFVVKKLKLSYRFGYEKLIIMTVMNLSSAT